MGSLADRIKPRLRSGVSDNRGRVSKFRQSMKDLGMVQVNTFVPDDQKFRLLALAELLRAEHMVWVVQNAPIVDGRRRVVADRNFVTLPEKNKIDYIDTMSRGNKLTLHPVMEKVREYATLCQKAKTLLEASEDDEEVVRFASEAVAYGSYAAALFADAQISLDDFLEEKALELGNNRHEN